jgi:hypothetical protein
VECLSFLPAWVGSWPCLQALAWAGKAGQAQTLRPICPKYQLQRKYFITLIPNGKVIKTFFFIAAKEA